MNKELEPFMEDARQLAAQCWCDKETENIEMDSRLAEACAVRIAAWMSTAAFHLNNEQYYRGLVVRCGEAMGPEAYIQDDGGKSEDVLCAKVPELVELSQVLYKDLVHYNGQLAAQINRLTSAPLAKTP